MSKGIFFGSYKIISGSAKVSDFSRKAFLFGGQGAGYNGSWKDLVIENSHVKEKIKIADEFLKEIKLPLVTDYLFKNNDNKIFDIITHNVGMLAIQVGIFESLINIGIKPQIITGHSFGEFACLVCSGAVEFQDMLQIIFLREQSSFPFLNLGGMLAVKTSESWCHENLHGMTYYVANKNSHEQIVISAPKDFLKKIQTTFHSKSIPSVPLAIAYPYHSPLMQQSADDFREKLKAKNWQVGEVKIPFYSSVLHRVVESDGLDLITLVKILTMQMTEIVDFVDQVKALEKMGIYNYIEISPKRTLLDFAKNIVSTEIHLLLAHEKLLDVSVSGRGAVATNSPKLTSTKLGSVFNKVISLVTGYEVESITIKDRMQEDLGIDSIKKAEIIFKILDQMGTRSITKNQTVNLSDLATVEDILTYFERQQRTINSNNSPEDVDNNDISLDKNFQIFSCGYTEKALSLFEKQIARKPEVLVVEYVDYQSKSYAKAIAAFYSKPSSQTPMLVQFVLSPKFEINQDLATESFDFFQNWLNDFIFFFRDIKILSPYNEGLLFFQFFYQEKDRFIGNVLTPLLKSWTWEQGSIGYKTIMVDDLPLSLEKFYCELGEVKDLYVSYKNNKRYIYELIYDDIRPKLGHKVNDSNSIVLGGLKGIGHEITKYLLDNSKGKVLVIGRSSSTDRNVQRKLADLLSYSERLIYVSCDTTHEAELDSIINSFIQNHGNVGKIIHSVGHASNKTLNTINDTEIESEVFVKIKTAIHAIKIQEKYNIDSVINFSSTTGFYGNSGQSTYSLANAFLDNLPSIFPKVKTILWPAWSKTGLTSNPIIESFINMTGLTYLNPSDGVLFFNKISNGEFTTSPYVVLDQNSKIRYEHASIDKKSYRQFFSTTQSPTISKVFDLSGLHLKNLPYLKDHMLAGEAVLAASNMIALFAHFAYLNWNEIPDVCNFEGFNFIFLQKDESVFYLECERNKDSFEISIKSTVVHSRATVIKNSNKEVRKLKIPKYSKPISAEKLKNPVIQTVGTFKYGDLLWGDPETKDVYLEFSPGDLHVCTEIALFDNLFQLIEIAHQAIGVTAQWRTGMIGVPKIIKRFHLNPNVSLTEKLFNLQEITHFDENIITGNSYIVNSEGEVLLELEGLTFAFIQKDKAIDYAF